MRPGPFRTTRGVGLLAVALLFSCTHPGCGARERTLYLVHASDMEGELLPRDGVGGLARFAGVLHGLLEKAPENTLVVAAGDTFMPGPVLSVRLEGMPAVALAHRSLPIAASALGNHEFDQGERFFQEMLEETAFPFLSATVFFNGGPLADRRPALEEGETPWAEASAGLILPRAKRCVGRLLPGGRCEGFVVGLVGATTERLDTVASVAPSARSLDDLSSILEAVQAEVDRLEAEGIDIVVLLSHLQGAHRELELLERGLRGVDVIVAGGGDDRLADPQHRLLPDDRPSPLCEGERRCYPLVREGGDGAPVVVVATDGQYRYLGRLGLRFDARGHVRWIDPVSRPWPVDDLSLEALGAAPDAEGLALQAKLRKALAPAETIVGRTVRRLNGEREAIRNRETNLGVLSADALVHAARIHGNDVDLGLRNGGSIRSSIGPEGGGSIRRYDVEASLRFDDAVVIVQTTHRMLKETLEAGLRDVGTGRGWFPQLSSDAVLVFDPEGTEQLRAGAEERVARAGGRVRELRFRRGEEVIEVVSEGRLLDPDAEIRLATLDYLTRGGDGYFPRDVGELTVVSPREGERLGEREALILFFRSHAWDEGKAYIDPPKKDVPVDRDIPLAKDQ